jgi:urease accessory protein
LRVSVRRRGQATVLHGLRQEGNLKARFPYPVSEDWLDIVTLNTSGGIAGGDRLESAFQLQPGAHATIVAQAAERFYRRVAGGAVASVRTQIEVAEGGAAEWLPQETILFDRCAVARQLDISLAADARFLGVECLVFGRTAMGERVEQASLRDLIRVRRDGQLLWHDAIRLDGEVHAKLQHKAIAAGACAIATVVHVAPDAEAALETVRAALHLPHSAASAWNGMLLARILANDSAALRRSVVAVLQALRGARPLPRVWLC